MGSTAAAAAPIVSDFDPAIVSNNPMGNPAQSNAAHGTIRTDRQGRHPLMHRHVRDNVVDKVCRGL